MVNFKPTEEQELLRETLASFVQDVVRPNAREADEKNAVPEGLPAKAWELGLVQDSIPEAHGGYGSERTAIGGSIMLEELAYGSLGPALHVVTPRLFTVPLTVVGTPEQQARWLPRFTGSSFTVGTAAFSEPRWDFDPTDLATRAERTADGWTLSGTKCTVPLAGQADAILVYAKAPDGLAAFIVEKGARGLSIGEREKNMGIKSLSTHRVTLDAVAVPASARLGGDGASVQALVDASRVAAASAAVGVGRAAFDYARDYAKERKAFGVAIGQKQAIAFMLADMAIEVDAIRLLAWEAAWRIDKGMPATREAVLAKQYAADKVLKIADDALQVLGGHGYIRDHLVELFLRDARGFASFDGIAIV
jgi:alkylation response protein AidB-like acyl-CoA dehydrogenase